jgi:hypothetical protein
MGSTWPGVPSSLNTSTNPPLFPLTLANVTYTWPSISWMPNGAKSAGSDASVNDFTRLKLPSNMSTLLFAMSAAYKWFPEVWLLIAKPVNTEPLLALFTATIAWLKFDCGAHPLMVPSDVANRKMDAHPCT